MHSEGRDTYDTYAAESYLYGGSSDKRDDHGHYIDGQLELKEFGDAVVDVTSPHDSLNDASEVIISQDDIRRFLSHIRTSDTLQIRQY